MKNKSLLFAAAVIAFGTAVSFHIGGSMRGRNSDQQSTHSIKKQLEYNVNSSIDEEIKKELIDCYVDQPGIFSNLAAKIKYESAVLTKTGNGKYMGFVKISTGDIIEVDILIDDEGFYYSAAKGWEDIKHSIVIERRKMGILTDFERSQDTLRKNIEEFEIRNNISIDRSYHPLDYRGMVTCILLNGESPLTIIDGEVFREGQSIRNVKVVKINQDSVEFETDGIRWSQKVNEQPSSFWP